MFQWDFGESVVNSFWNALLVPWHDWLSQHPRLIWLTTHPLWLLGLSLLILFLFSGLIKAIASITEKVWLLLLSLPFKLVQWTWQGSLFLLKQPFLAKTEITKLEITDVTAKNTRLNELLNRLEALQREQNELVQEVRRLIDSNHNRTSE